MNATCFLFLLIGALFGVIGMLVWVWFIAKTLKHEDQDDWWKNGDPPPY
jgi:uncharacterized protein involved in response to NO